MKRERRLLREKFRKRETVVTGGAYDGLSAKIIEKAGFDAVHSGGFGSAGTLLGLPDLGLVSLSERVSLIERIVGAVNIPVTMDMEQGYGNAINVKRSVREFERAGISALFMDDKVVEECPFLPGKELSKYYKGCISIEEMSGKLRAAIDAREDKDLIIMVRTNIRGRRPWTRDSLDKAIERSKAYVKAGAEAINAQVGDLEELKIFDKALNVPLYIVNEGYSINEILKTTKNAFLISYPTTSIRVVAKALMEAMKTLKSKGAIGAIEDQMYSYEEYANVVDLPKIAAEIAKYYP